MTIGRVTCERFWAAVGAGPRSAAPGPDDGAAWDWAQKRETVRAWEDAAAEAVAWAVEHDCVPAVRELRGELADMRALLSEVLSGFSATGVPGMGYTARADDADFERWLKLGGIEAL